jgi:hypothetical protein
MTQTTQERKKARKKERKKRKKEIFKALRRFIRRETRRLHSGGTQTCGEGRDPRMGGRGFGGVRVLHSFHRDSSIWRSTSHFIGV